VPTYVLYPVTVDVLAIQDNMTEWVTGATPVPARAIVCVPPDALLATSMLPVIAPLAAGVNVAFKVAVWPGVRTVPADRPLALNPAPEMLTFEIVTFAVPAFVSVTLCELLLETFTLPKVRLAELTLRTGVPGFTVRMAVLLTTLPTLLVIATVNCAPLSALVVAAVVYEEEIAPLIGFPFLSHW
jgi:hypothetical protein